MNKNYEYKGVVVLMDNNFYLFIEKDNGQPTDGISISNTNNIYDYLKRTQIQMVSVLLLDGTEPMELEDVLQNRPKFEDIFFKIKDYDLITIGDANLEEIKISDLFTNNDFVGVFKDVMKQFNLK
jgi:hypothetical protein